MLTGQDFFEAAFDGGIGIERYGEVIGDSTLINEGRILLDDLATEKPDAYMTMLRGRMARLSGVIPYPEL